MSRKLIVMVGLPRSGKSTWARQQGHPIVNGDSVRLALHGERFLAQAEPVVHVITPIMVEALFLAGHETVIVDECNVSLKRREPWMRLAEKLGAEIVFEVIDTLPSCCVQRAMAENDDVILPVIERMAREWDMPFPSSWTN